MASEHPGETSVSLTLPESLSEWLDDVAQAEDLSREDVLLQLLTAYRQVDGEGDPRPEGALDDGDLSVRPTEGPADEFVAELRADIESMVEEELAEREAEGTEDIEQVVESVVGDRFVDQSQLDDSIDDVESTFAQLLEDVRERVVQVKREVDAKASEDHDHPDLAEDVEAATADLGDLAADVSDLEDRVDTGFENFEEVLSYLDDSVDGLSVRQTTLARALVETRDEMRALASKEAARAAADELRREANRAGISTARCEDCDSQVDVSLLSRAQCPHCSATFTDVESSSGFFGKHMLRTGDQPALEAGDAPGDTFEQGVEEIIESESPTQDGGDESQE